MNNFQMEKIFIGAWKDKRGISDVSLIDIIIVF